MQSRHQVHSFLEDAAYKTTFSTVWGLFSSPQLVKALGIILLSPLLFALFRSYLLYAPVTPYRSMNLNAKGSV